jgi:hypothetical protein
MTNLEATGGTIAVDVAIIPPDWVQEKARLLNGSLYGPPEGFRFDETHFPHASLAQFFTMRASLPLLIGVLDIVLSERKRFDVTVLATVAKDRTVSYLLDRTEELWSLHDSLMNAVREWEEQEGTAAAFFCEGETPRDKDIEWVLNYRTAAAYRKFVPHITLGVGDAPATGSPFDFIADRVGLFQLGRFCTCRRLIREWKL